MDRRIPRVVWLLGLVSLCMDLSSEMIHALLPVFVVSTLGASALTLGVIEGVAEGTASIAKVFSGIISDRFRRRKPLVVLGYGLAALSKPLFPLANSAGWVLVARFADRVGKGIRGAPAQCAHHGRYFSRYAWRSIWIAASARYGGRPAGAARWYGAHDRAGRRCADRFLGGRAARAGGRDRVGRWNRGANSARCGAPARRGAQVARSTCDGPSVLVGRYCGRRIYSGAFQ